MNASLSQATPIRTRIDIQSIFRLAELADYIIPFAIRVACELGVADKLVDGPRHADELAQQTGAHGPSLYRLLRALACKGIFSEAQPGYFALTPIAELLRSDHPLSMRSAYPLVPADVRAWGNFMHSVRTGEAAFDPVHGLGYWEYLAEHPQESVRIDGAQQAQTRLELKVVLRAYEWSRFEHVVDVGGGNGAFLAGLLARYSTMRGALFDLPHVLQGASRVLGAAGVADRCELIPGSFFESVPQGADAYLLKRILYGWDDEKAVELLRTVRSAMTLQSRLILIEPLMGPKWQTEMSARYDLLMLTMIAGCARTEERVRELLAAADLSVISCTPTLMFPIVEAQPVPRR